jgi:hypothetical protein
MAGKSRKWPEGCAIGCGALVVLGLVFGGITWLGMMQLSHKAIESRAALDQAYPSQETFTPALDGSIAPDRIERFIAVREALMVACPQFTEHRAVFQRMQKYDEAEEEPPAGDFLNVTGSMPSGGSGATSTTTPSRETKPWSSTNWGSASTPGSLSSPTTAGSAMSPWIFCSKTTRSPRSIPVAFAAR